VVNFLLLGRGEEVYFLLIFWGVWGVGEEIDFLLIFWESGGWGGGRLPPLGVGGWAGDSSSFWGVERRQSSSS
jgi:hypothetical protein